MHSHLAINAAKPRTNLHAPEMGAATDGDEGGLVAHNCWLNPGAALLPRRHAKQLAAQRNHALALRHSAAAPQLPQHYVHQVDYHAGGQAFLPIGSKKEGLFDPWIAEFTQLQQDWRTNSFDQQLATWLLQEACGLI